MFKTIKFFAEILHLAKSPLINLTGVSFAMSKRSLRLSPTGVRKAKQQFAAKGWTQEYLAIEIGIKTRQPIWRFFGGEPIERFTFFEICTILDLDWREIALDPPAESIDRTADRSDAQSDSQSDSQSNALSLDELVQQVRSQRKGKIAHQCGILQLLDINRPVSIDKIYVDIDVLEQIPSLQKLEIDSLDNLTPEEVDRPGFGIIRGSQIPGIQAVVKYNKLRVLGKTGAGKTTFLKYLAVQCDRAKLAANKVPVFITLRDFAESYRTKIQPNLLEFIHQEFITSDIPELETLKLLLHGGRVLFLIDGMDELSSEDSMSVLNEIRRFSEKYYRNHFVVSRRTAFHKLLLQGFTDVEIAHFNKTQIHDFTQKWFREFSQTNAADALTRASQFLAMLELPEKQRFQRLMSTPLFLHLACSLFHHTDQLRLKKADFYKQITYLLFEKWDEFKGIKRDKLHSKLLVPQLLDLSCELAFSLFEHKQFLYTLEIVGGHLTNFMKKLLPLDAEVEERYYATEIIVQSAKSQPYGFAVERARDIFSFAYLALHEYLTARKIVVSYELQRSEEFLQKLVQHITDPHWREIFLLTATMLRSGDRLVQLMKQEIDGFVAEDPYLQDFLIQAHQKLRDKILQEGLDESASPDLGFYKLLQQINNPLPDSDRGEVLQTQQAIATRQEIINQWEFTPHQQLVLQHYYDANQLLLDCLNSGSEVTPSLREKIETTLLLPQTELGSGMTSPL